MLGRIPQGDERGDLPRGSHVLERIPVPKELQDVGEWQRLVDAGDLTPFNVLCSWTDLSGVGNRLRKARWDLQKAQELGLLRHIAYLYRRAADRSFSTGMQERILVLNDGVARAIDVPTGVDLRALIHHLGSLMYAHLLLIRHLDLDYSVRTVLAGGQRIQYSTSSESSPTPPADRPEEEPQEYSERLLIVYNPAVFQMNTAFSRAYELEHAGKLESGGFYIATNWIGTFLFVPRLPRMAIAGDWRAPGVCVRWSSPA